MLTLVNDAPISINDDADTGQRRADLGKRRLRHLSTTRGSRPTTTLTPVNDALISTNDDADTGQRRADLDNDDADTCQRRADLGQRRR